MMDPKRVFTLQIRCFVGTVEGATIVFMDPQAGAEVVGEGHAP
jgi:hypothetical protein